MLSTKALTFLGVFALLCGAQLSCQHISRKPNSLAVEDSVEWQRTLTDLYEAQLQLQLEKKKIFDAYADTFRKQKSVSLETVESKLEAIDSAVPKDTLETFKEKLQAASKKLSQNHRLKEQPTLLLGQFSKPWRRAEDVLVIPAVHFFPLEKSGEKKYFFMERSGAKEYRLKFSTQAFSNESHPEDAGQYLIAGASVGQKNFTPKVQNRSYLEARISCTGRFSVGKKRFSAGAISSIKIYDDQVLGLFGENPVLKLEPGTQECQVRFINVFAKNPEWRVVHLVDEKPFVAQVEGQKLNTQVHACVMPSAHGYAGPEAFFLNVKYLSMTCPEPVQDIVPLVEPVYEGLNAKVEALLGYEIEKHILDQQNPFLPLDFSRAPNLDYIVISSLFFRADFYGHLLSRLVKFHALRGTKVRILSSKVIQLAKDRAMLNELEAASGNIKVQHFRYRRQKGTGYRGWVDAFHRTDHVKIFLTWSRQVPENNRFITGGRNIHDGSLFFQAPDYSQYPNMVNYAGGDDVFVHWRDYEVEVRSPSFVDHALAHYLSFWERDSEDQFVRSLNVNIPLEGPVDPSYFQKDKAYVRHLLSTPYNDGRSLEDLYVELFDSAKKSLKIASPYFRPTKKLSAALERAVSRGVRVVLVTRLEFKGDTSKAVSRILTESNKAAVNKFIHRLEIYNWTEPNVILHTKAVVVDDVLTSVGGVNMNKRSFFHDVEGTLLIYDRKYGRTLSEMIDAYVEKSEKITTEQMVKWWAAPVILLLDDLF